MPSLPGSRAYPTFSIYGKMALYCTFCCFCRDFFLFEAHLERQSQKNFSMYGKMTSCCKFCCYYRHFSYFTHLWTDIQKCEVCGKNRRGSSFSHIWKSLWKSFSTAGKQVNVVVVLFESTAFCSIFNYLDIARNQTVTLRYVTVRGYDSACKCKM